MKIFRIIKAKLINKYRNKNEDWVKERRAICAICPFQSDNVENKKGLRFFILKLLNLNNPFCTDCGCEIKAKTAEKLEMCPQRKWNEITD